MSPPPIFTAPTVYTASTAWPTAWVDLFTLKVMVPTTHIYWVHCVSWPFCTNTYCVHCVHCINCVTHCMGWPFCTKGNDPHHPYLLSTLYELTFWHQHLLCPLCPLHPLHPLHGLTFFALKVMVPTTHICWVHCVSWPFAPTATTSIVSTVWVDLFAVKLMVPTTHICWVHCVSWPFCTNTCCIHCIHCVTHCMGWPFCTKGNGSHHPYLFSTLCELTFLHQHLLCTLCPHCIHCYPTCPTLLNFLHLQSVPLTHQCYL